MAFNASINAKRKECAKQFTANMTDNIEQNQSLKGYSILNPKNLLKFLHIAAQ
jgi:hypothetical protein